MCQPLQGIVTCGNMREADQAPSLKITFHLLKLRKPGIQCC